MENKGLAYKFKDAETMVSVITRAGSTEAHMNVVGDKDPYIMLALVSDAMETIITKNAKKFRSKEVVEAMLVETVKEICDSAFGGKADEKIS